MLSRKIMGNVAFSKFKDVRNGGYNTWPLGIVAKVVYKHHVLSFSPYETLLSNFAFTYLHLILNLGHKLGLMIVESNDL